MCDIPGASTCEHLGSSEFTCVFIDECSEIFEKECRSAVKLIDVHTGYL